MDRDFKLGQSNEVVSSGQVYDLHNDYLPAAIIVDTQSNMLRLVFRKIMAEGDGGTLVLRFRDLDVLEFSGDFGASNSAGLDEMGYKDADDYDYDWLSTESQSKSTDHMILRFDGSGVIRVHCASADVVEDPPMKAVQINQD